MSTNVFLRTSLILDQKDHFTRRNDGWTEQGPINNANILKFRSETTVNRVKE